MERDVTILAIESSCDETAAAVVENGREVLSSVVASQVEEHRKYGGVVPEIASRRHCENIVLAWWTGALEEAGLHPAPTWTPWRSPTPRGSSARCWWGSTTPRGLPMAAGKPLIPVHHIRAHIAANYIAHPDLEPPFLCLVASGGHSHIIEVLDPTPISGSSAAPGTTRPGKPSTRPPGPWAMPYPGGVHSTEPAPAGEPRGVSVAPPPGGGQPLRFQLFRPENRRDQHRCTTPPQKGRGDEPGRPLAASFQKTVVRAAQPASSAGGGGDRPRKPIVLAGGVSANSGLRARLAAECRKQGFAARTCRPFPCAGTMPPW